MSWDNFCINGICYWDFKKDYMTTKTDLSRNRICFQFQCYKTSKDSSQYEVANLNGTTLLV